MIVGAIVLFGFAYQLYEAFSNADGHGPSRAESLNNLKNIVLSTHNYASQHDGKVPPYALVGPEGTENFGWTISLLPYLENTALYGQIDLEKPWNDPANRESSSVHIKIFLNPLIQEPTEDSGYPLLHYAANSQVFRSDKTWSLDEISAKDGLTNTILFGEISNHFRPWAAPGSLRDPAAGIGNGPNQFGMEGKAGLVSFGFADGSARLVNRNIDPKILKAWATPDGGEIIPE